MLNDLVPVRVDPNSASRDFWARYHAYRRARQQEVRADEPIRPDDLEEDQMRAERRFEQRYWYEVAGDGQMLGWFGASTPRPGSPGYDSNRHLMNASASVAREHRRHGIARKCLRLLLELMDAHGCTVATIASSEESGVAFLEWAGGQAKLTDRESRLELEGVDWDMVQRWVDEGAARSPQTRLEMYSGRLPESMWQDYSSQLQRLLNLIPFGNLDHGEIVITPESMVDWYSRIDALQESLETIVARDTGGTIVGITDVAWPAPIPEFVQQRFTGVAPEARGRGLGKWIKAAMLLRIRELNPRARWVSTGNASSNDPMLAINHRLGFKLYRLHTEFQITRDVLATTVGSLGSS